jgi:FtsZ-binding cell division protein ZapB
MISLEHIRTLENKVNKAVSTLAALQEENLQLKAKLAQYKARIEELEFTVEEYREDQSEIEQGIMQALQHLDNLESAVGGLKSQPAAPEAQTAPVEAAAPVQHEAVAPAVPAESVAPEPDSEAPAEAPVEETHWEAPVQQFQPAPLPQEEYEPVAPPEEPETSPNREQQLDIF